MGAHDFYTVGTGATAKDAFRTAVEDDLYEYGHDPYTGDIGQKESFVIVPTPDGATDEHCYDHASRLVRLNRMPRGTDDKWGPCAALRMPDGPDGNQRWLFFGWCAS